VDDLEELLDLRMESARRAHLLRLLDGDALGLGLGELVSLGAHLERTVTLLDLRLDLRVEDAARALERVGALDRRLTRLADAPVVEGDEVLTTGLRDPGLVEFVGAERRRARLGPRQIGPV